MKNLVIFDLDGTLLNTIADLGNAVNEALRRHGYTEHPIEAYNYMVGNGVRRLIERAIPSEARSEEIVNRLLLSFREHYDKHMCDMTIPYPGIPELLDELHGRGIALAICSNKYESAVKKLMAKFFPTINFAAVCGQIDGYPPKPDPSIVFRLLLTAPAPKSGILYVGDSAVDIETARRACVDSVAVSWGFRPMHELTAANPTHIIKAPAELLNLL